jgi:hypothetical protein
MAAPVEMWAEIGEILDKTPESRQNVPLVESNKELAIDIVQGVWLAILRWDFVQLPTGNNLTLVDRIAGDSPSARMLNRTIKEGISWSGQVGDDGGTEVLLKLAIDPLHESPSFSSSHEDYAKYTRSLANLAAQNSGFVTGAEFLGSNCPRVLVSPDISEGKKWWLMVAHPQKPYSFAVEGRNEFESTHVDGGGFKMVPHGVMESMAIFIHPQKA